MQVSDGQYIVENRRPISRCIAPGSSSAGERRQRRPFGFKRVPPAIVAFLSESSRFLRGGGGEDEIPRVRSEK